MSDGDRRAYGETARNRLIWLSPVLVLAIFVGICVWATLEPRLPDQPKAETECHYAQETDRGKRSAGPTVVLCVQPATQAEAQNAKPDNGNRKDLLAEVRHWLNRTIRDPIAAFTGLLFLVTLALWWATQQTLRHARQSARIQLRAYVFPENINFDVEAPNSAVGTPITGLNIRVVLKNSGSTPARRVFTDIQVGRFSQSLDASFGFPPNNPSGEISHPVGPGQSTWLQDTISVADLQSAVNGDFLYIWAWVEYYDVFPGTQRRRTEIAFRVMPERNPMLVGMGSVRAENLGTFNAFDDDCTGPIRTK